MNFSSFLRRALAFFARRLLSLRYRVKIVGKELLKDPALKAGALVLPNHPAEIDPIIVFSQLARYLDLSPTVVEHFYYYPGMAFFNKLLKAIPIPGFDQAVNKMKIETIADCHKRILARIEEGGAILLYPAGKLKLSPHESIGGASMVHKLCQESPKTPVLLVRISGLWGSNFSKAFIEASPDFWQVARNHIKDALMSGLFFMPRREVLIEIERAPEDFPHKASRYIFNRYLEDWYNRYPSGEGRVAEEPLKEVPYRTFASAAALSQRKVVQRGRSHVPFLPDDEIDPALADPIIAEIAKISRRDVSAIGLDDRFSQELGFDSLDAAELFIFLQSHYEIDPHIEPHHLQTPRDLLAVAHSLEMHAPKKVDIDASHKKKGWQEKKSEREIRAPTALTVLEAFLETATRESKKEAAADPQTPSITYGRMKIGVVLLRKLFASFTGRYVGILLPASVGASTIYFALLAAGKIPVFINWTTGARAIDHMIELLGIEEIVTSRRFLDRLNDVEFGKGQELLVLMEDLRSKIRLKDKIFAAIKAKQNAAKLMEGWGLSRDASEETAIILMTSGTSKLPKAVPLTNANVLENVKDIWKAVELRGDDILLSILPPFHSFGFTVCMVTPLVLGLRALFYPDPKDARGITEISESYRPTLVTGAPTFLHQIVRVAKIGQLDSVRLFVTGAEAPSPSFLRDAKKVLPKSALIIEGYGCTECSPAVAVDRPSQPTGGIGTLLDSFEAVLLNPETLLPVGSGERGLLCVRGPCVFKGYLGEEESPFVQVGGKSFYNTGDLVSIDPAGHFVIHGRIKRFTKIGGEMVSLVAVEEVIQETLNQRKRLPKKDDKLDVAAVAFEGEGKTLLVLFSRVPLELTQVNAILREKGGFSNLVKISHILSIDEIPVNGAGKILFGKLQEKAKAMLS